MLGIDFRMTKAAQVGIVCWYEPLRNEAERSSSRKDLELSEARRQKLEPGVLNEGEQVVLFETTYGLSL